MQTVKSKPFNVTRIPANNGEWIDIHVTESGNVAIDTSGYVEIDLQELVAALKSLKN